MKAAAAFAILNFVWQGAAIGALAAAGFAIARTPRVRYLVGVVALALMAIAPLATGVVSLRRAAVQGSSFNVQGSPEIEVAATRSGGEALRQGTQSFGEPGTSNTRFSWATDRLDDPRVTSMVLVFWIVGVAALSLRLAFGWIGARRLTRRVAAAGADLQALADRLIVKLRIRATVEVVESALVNVPSVIGAFKPVVLLPAAAMSGLSMEQVEALLAHELAHVRRHDYLVNLLQSAIETLLFYHPAVWLVSRRVRQERELCCDDLALEVCGDRLAYASALADLESLRALPSPALAATGGSLLARIRRILGTDESRGVSRRSKSVAGVAILTAIALVIATQATRASKLQTIEGLADSISPGQIQIFPAQAVDARRAEWAATPPQGSSVQGGVAGGVVGGTQGGVKGGVKGGVPERVAAEIEPPQTAPVEARPTPENYLIRVGDELSVSLSTPIVQPEFSARTYRVQPDGTILLPHLDRPLKVSGLAIKQSGQLIRQAMIDAQQYSNPTVNVIVTNYRSPDPVEVPAEPQQAAGPPIAVGQIIRLEVAVGQVRQPEFNKDYTVQPDGTIVVPYVGATKAAGSDTYSLQSAITAALNAKNTLPGAKVSASIETRPAAPPPAAVYVTVQGAVRMPGDVTLRTDRDHLTDSITKAGGLQPGAGQHVYVRRPGFPASVYLMTDLQAGKLNDIRVLDGDTIVVEVAPQFGVTGFVKKPGQYNWEPGMTAEKAIALAGGRTPEGSPSRFTIKRKDPKTGAVVVLRGLKPDAAIEPDDIVEVGPRYF